MAFRTKTVGTICCLPKTPRTGRIFKFSKDEDVMKSDKEKEDLLWIRSFFLIGDQVYKNSIWKDGFGEQFKEVSGRLIIYHTNQVLYLENISYDEAFKEKLMNKIGEFLGMGVYIYCADLVDIRKQFDSYFDIRMPDDPGLKDYLVKEIGIVEDGGKVKEALEPPKYIFNTIKRWFFFYFKKILPEDTTIGELQSETQKEFLITKLIWLIATGYMQASLTERYHKIWVANNRKIDD